MKGLTIPLHPNINPQCLLFAICWLTNCHTSLKEGSFLPHLTWKSAAAAPLPIASLASPASLSCSFQYSVLTTHVISPLGSSIPSFTRQRNRHHQRQQLSFLRSFSLLFLSHSLFNGLERPLATENSLSHRSHNTHSTLHHHHHHHWTACNRADLLSAVEDGAVLETITGSLWCLRRSSLSLLCHYDSSSFSSCSPSSTFLFGCCYYYYCRNLTDTTRLNRSNTLQHSQRRVPSGHTCTSSMIYLYLSISRRDFTHFLHWDEWH